MKSNNKKIAQMERLEEINELISFIVTTDGESRNPTLGTRGESGELIACHFHFAENGLLYFTDSYTKEQMRPLNHLSWNGFSSGGTMRELVTQFARFIMTGQQGYLNDYKEMWGWKVDDMLKVRKKAKEAGFIVTSDYPFSRYEDS